MQREEADPRSAAVPFVTTEHFTLQGARTATIAESVGRVRYQDLAWERAAAEPLTPGA